MENDNTNLFPEKDLIDLKFMDHIRFNSFVPTNKTEVDKAIQEYNCLISNFKKCTSVYSQLQRELDNKYNAVSKKLSDTADTIMHGVEQCIGNNYSEFGINFNGKEKCEIEFEHGKIILEQKTINKLKIKEN